MTTLADANCLVLGGGGFIGTNLCIELLRNRAAVRGFGRRPHHSKALSDVPWIEAEFDDTANLRSALDGVDVVFHLLGSSLPATSNIDPAADVASAVLPSVRLLDACNDARVGKIVFFSSGGTVYGKSKSSPLTEHAATDPISAYGIGKLAVEKYIQLAHHLHGLDYTIFRVANPYGPYQNPNRPQGIVGVVMGKVLLGERIEIWGDGSIIRDFIFVQDLVEGVVLAASLTKSARLFNIGSGIGRSLRTVIADIATVAGESMTDVTYLPGRTADVPINVLDSSLLEAELAWRPHTKWMQGLEQTYDWLKTYVSQGLTK